MALGLAAQAQKHNAKMKNEPEADGLAAFKATGRSVEVLGSMENGGGGEAGRQGKVTAFGKPHIQLSAPAGIVAGTSRNVIVTADDTASMSAGQDINFAAQGSTGIAVNRGISLFSYGKAANSKKPNQEAGLKLHAASGKLSSQSQSGVTSVVADKLVTIASVGKSVAVAAPKKHVLLTAQGAYIKLEGVDIEVHAPGKVDFKATKKDLCGPQNVAVESPNLPKPQQLVPIDGPLFSQQFDLSHLTSNHPIGFSSENLPYEVFDKEGKFIARGQTNAEELTERFFTKKPTQLVVFIGAGSWTVEEYIEEQA